MNPVLTKIKNKILHKKAILLTVGLATIIAVLGFTLWTRETSAAQFMTGKIERGNLRNSVTATGTLQAVTTVQVGSQASGTISALYADFNSNVRKGQIVAQLDPATSDAQLASARANREQARASLADAQAKLLAAQAAVQNQRAGVSGASANLAALRAQRDDAQSLLNRQVALSQNGLIPAQDLETARTNFRAADARYNQATAQLDQARVGEQSSAGAGLAQAQAAIQQARAQLQQSEAAMRLAEVNLSHTTIRSPIDGVVVSRDVSVGQTVAASLSAPTLFTIANDLTQMQVIANIDQADIGVINASNRADFTVDAYPGETFHGTIQQVRLNPQNVQNVITYNVVIDVRNPDLKLKPGLTANLTITVDERNDVLKIPNAALRFRPQNTGNAQTRGEGRRSSGEGADNRRESNFAPATAAVLPGQMRAVWIPGPNNLPQRRIVKIGITDGTTTEIVEGDLKEGDTVITGQTISGENRPQTTGQRPPGFGGPTGGGGGGGRRR